MTSTLIIPFVASAFFAGAVFVGVRTNLPYIRAPRIRAARTQEIKILCASAGAFLAALSFLASHDPLKTLFLGALYGGIGWFGPAWYEKRRALYKKRSAVKSLGYILELLRLQVGGGQNLEHAIGNIAKNAGGVWGKELSRISFALERGVPFEEAIAQLARRMNLEDLDRLVLALRQARELGASLSDTLAIQSEALRARRRQRAEEQARVASVKISIPLVFCIFPALLIIYLAPAVLRIMEAF